MCSNNYLNTDLQKAFLPTNPGVGEHQAKLAAVIKSARHRKQSLVGHRQCLWECPPLTHPWLTTTPLPSSAGCCRHGVQACLPPSQPTIGVYYTDPVPLRIGVYQGDPLSVVIFLTVMNTLSDTLCTRGDLGFSLPQSSTSINHLLYTDDVCVISSTPAGCQHLLDMVQRWLEWAQLKAKVPKCHSMVI